MHRAKRRAVARNGPAAAKTNVLSARRTAEAASPIASVSIQSSLGMTTSISTISVTMKLLLLSLLLFL